MTSNRFVGINLPMTMPRSNLICLSDTPWYHIVSRCVRRAFLCGVDHVSGKNFEHRRGWIERRIRELAGVFAIDVAAYAVMSNHFHIVLRVDQERALGWDDAEVLRRWTQIFTGPDVVQRYLGEHGDSLSETDRIKVAEWVEVYRLRLFDISWFMRILNESLARMANAEDGVKGRFWEGRFKSQALLDEQSLLAAMAYVDLNPVRAGLAPTPENSEHTSIKLRLEQLSNPSKEPQEAPARAVPAATSPQAPQPSKPTKTLLPLADLMPFDPGQRRAVAIPFAFDDYLELVDSVGRVVRPDKRGAILEKTPAILERLLIDPAQFISYANGFFQEFGPIVGTPASLRQAAVSARQIRCARGVAVAKAIFGKVAS